MPQSNIAASTTTNLTASVPDYAVSSKTSSAEFSKEENEWFNPDASKFYGFYFGVGEYRSSVNAFGTWCVGQGYVCPLAEDQVILDNVDGNGDDTALSVFWQAIVVKKFNGDSYTQVIRDPDSSELVNLKPLDPRRITHVLNKEGRFKNYKYDQGDGEKKKLELNEVLHLCNDRVLDEPHGTAVTSGVEWVINKILQAREDYARLMHVSSVRIFFVDEQDTTRQNVIKTQYADAIKNGEVMMLTCKPEDAKFQDLTVPPSEAWIIWLNYLEDKFYKQLGVPKVVLGGTAENTEASAKVGVISYEPIWTREIAELEAAIKNQLGITIKFNRQPSLMQNMQADEAKNTGQTKLKYQGGQ